jgi:hypothetical protein
MSAMMWLLVLLDMINLSLSGRVALVYKSLLSFRNLSFLQGKWIKKNKYTYTTIILKIFNDIYKSFNLF